MYILDYVDTQVLSGLKYSTLLVSSIIYPTILTLLGLAGAELDNVPAVLLRYTGAPIVPIRPNLVEFL